MDTGKVAAVGHGRVAVIAGCLIARRLGGNKREVVNLAAALKLDLRKAFRFSQQGNDQHDQNNW